MALYDPSPVEIKDLGTQFYLAEADVGQPTAAACKDKLQELNKAVTVGVIDAVSESVLAQFQVRKHRCTCYFAFNVRACGRLECAVRVTRKHLALPIGQL